MALRPLLVPTMAFISCCLVPGWGAEPAPAPDLLPTVGAAADQAVVLRTVVLFSSGVGYFEHAGSVDGNASCELPVRTSQLNDLLKSLLLDDLDGGHPGGIDFPSLDPIAKTLASFQVDLSRDPSLGGLLAQLRGAQVRVSVAADQPVEGTVLGVEQRTVALGDQGTQTMTVPVLNLLVAGTVRQLRIDALQGVTFTDAHLQEELTKALAALAQARSQDKKTVVLHFDGAGRRRVRLAYVVETPVWKTSYRLILPDAKATGAAATTAHLQGWAIIENQTDADWKDVRLSLVSGRPISFIEDLSRPLYLQRPEVVPQLYASLMPQRDEGALFYAKDDGTDAKAEENMGGIAADGAPGGLRQRRHGFAAAHSLQAAAFGAATTPASGLDATRAIQAAARGDTLGQLFSYTVPSVTVMRQHSAMLPIITSDIQVERVSIYNPDVLPAHPLNGALVTNTTGDLLLQGPMTVLDGGGYAGDASLDNLSQQDHRLISYAIDLPVKVDSTTHADTDRIMAATLTQGTLTLSVRLVSHRTYQFASSDGAARTIVLEHPFTQGWSLVDTPEPFEHTPTLDRWKVALPAQGHLDVTVSEQLVQEQAMAVTNLDTPQIELYAKDGAISKPVQDALAQLAAGRRAIADLQHQLEEDGQEDAHIREDQARVRQDLFAADRASAYWQRLQQKLSDQENRIDALEHQMQDLRAHIDQQQQALTTFLLGLNLR